MSWFKKDVKVEIVAGNYKGNNGVIVNETPKKIRLQLEDQTKPILIEKTSVRRFGGFLAASRSSSKSKFDKIETPSKSKTPSPVPSPEAVKESTPSPPPPVAKLSLSPDPVRSTPSASSKLQRLHSTQITEAYEEPAQYMDPMFLSGLSLIGMDCLDGSPQYQTFAVAFLYLFTKVGSSPPRAPMSDMDWMAANYFLVIGCLQAWEAFGQYQILGAAAIEGSSISTDSVITTFIYSMVGYLCIQSYVSMIQAKANAEVSKVVSCTLILAQLHALYYGSLGSMMYTEATVLTKEHIPVGYQSLFNASVVFLIASIVTLILMNSWTKITTRFM